MADKWHTVEVRPGVSMCPKHSDVERKRKRGGLGDWYCSTCQMERDQKRTGTLNRSKEQFRMRVRLSMKAQDILGGKCVVCGSTDRAILEFDHINNDGSQHRLQIGRGGDVLKNWIIKNPTEAQKRIQILCACCHARKVSVFTNVAFIEGWDYDHRRKAS